MKSFILLASFALSISVTFAAESVIASYRHATVNYSSGHSPFGMPTTVYEVALKSNSKIVTTITKYNQGTETKPAKQVITKIVRPAVMKLLLEDIKTLANAEVVTEKHDIVCMMMPSPEMSNDNLSVARDFDYETNSFKSAVTLVSGPHGCWLHETTSLKNDWENETAALLKRSLKLISL